jgi:hypothetical protein
MRAHALAFPGRVRSPSVAFSLFLPRVFNRAECLGNTERFLPQETFPALLDPFFGRES